MWGSPLEYLFCAGAPIWAQWDHIGDQSGPLGPNGAEMDPNGAWGPQMGPISIMFGAVLPPLWHPLRASAWSSAKKKEHPKRSEVACPPLRWSRIK